MFHKNKSILPNFEWIIISDTDTPPPFPYIKIIHPERKGVLDALNKAVGEASFPWLLFLKDGDSIDSRAIKVLRHYCKIFPYHRYINTGGAFLGFLRRDIFDDIGLLDTAFKSYEVGEYEFTLRMALHEPILDIPECLYKRPRRAKPEVHRSIHKHILRSYLKKFLNIKAPPSPKAIKKGPLLGVSILSAHGHHFDLLAESLDSISMQSPLLKPLVLVQGDAEHFQKAKDQFQHDEDISFLHVEGEKHNDGHALNIALDHILSEKTQYNYLCFLNEGDILYPFFSHMMQESLHFSGADVVYSTANKYPLSQDIVRESPPLPPSFLIAENFICPSSYTVTTAFLRQSKAHFNEELKEDYHWDFLLSLWNGGGDFYFFPETLSKSVGTIKQGESNHPMTPTREKGKKQFLWDLLHFKAKDNHHIAQKAYNLWLSSEGKGTQNAAR